MTFWETVERGEYVMIALAVIFILCLCIWWMRALKLSKQRKSYSTLMQRVRDHISEGDMENARQLCEVTSSPGAQVLCAGVSMIGKPMPEIKDAMDRAISCQRPVLSRGTLWLRAFGVISPLLGLGGTLVGIIDRLRDLGMAGSEVDLSALCASIAPTIVTTVAGLGVGIFALVALTFLSSAIIAAEKSLFNLEGEFTQLLNSPS